MSLALVLGGAACVWDDAKAALALARPDLVIAINDMIPRWPGPLDAVASLHPVNLPGWLAARRRAGLEPPAQVWSYKLESKVTHTTADWRGSSGLLALKVALVERGCTGAILAGVPMDRSPHFVRGGEVWGDAHAFYPGWIDHKRFIEKRARSFSGWTRLLLGAPTPEWLAQVKAAPPEFSFNEREWLERVQVASTTETPNMSKQYQGKNVRNVRDARQGDPGFQQGQDQVVITLEDGSEKTVRKSEVTGQ